MAPVTARALVFAASLAAGAVALLSLRTPSGSLQAAVGIGPEAPVTASARASVPAAIAPAPRTAATAIAAIEAPAGSALASLLAVLHALPRAPTTPAAAFLRRCEPDAIDLARALDALPRPPRSAEARRIEGVVVDDRGAPLAGALVEVSLSQAPSSDVKAKPSRLDGDHAGSAARLAIVETERRNDEAPATRTGPDGTFSLPVLTATRHYVRGSLEGYAPIGDAWEGNGRMRLQLRASARVIVHVEGWPAGTLAGAPEYVYVDLESFEEKYTRHGRRIDLPGKGPPGEARAFEVTPGRWCAIASAWTASCRWGGTSEPFDVVASGDPVSVTVTVASDPALTIRAVLPAGERARPEVIAWLDRAGNTADGIYAQWPRKVVLRGEYGRTFPAQPDDRSPEAAGAALGEMVETLRTYVDPGTYSLSVGRAHDREPVGPFTRPVTLEIGASGLEHRVRLEPVDQDGIVAVTLVGPYGEALFEGEIHNGEIVARHGATTWLRLRDLGALRSVQLWATDRYARPPRGPLAIEVPVPLPAEVTARFQVPARVSIVTVDEQGQTLEPADVFVSLEPSPALWPPITEGWREGSAGFPLKPASTERGVVTFEPVQPGGYDVVVRGHGSILARHGITVGPGEASYTVRVGSPGSLTVRAARAGTLALRPAGTTYADMRPRTVSAAATVRFEGVSPGDFLVHFTPTRFSRDEPAAFARRVTVPCEATVEIGLPETPGQQPGVPAGADEVIVDGNDWRPRRASAPAPAPDLHEPSIRNPASGRRAEDAVPSQTTFPASSTSSACAWPDAPTSTADPAALTSFDAAARRLATPGPEDRLATGTARIAGVVRDGRGAALAGVPVEAHLESVPLQRSDDAAREEMSGLGLRRDLAAALAQLLAMRSAAARTWGATSGPDGAYAIVGVPEAIHEVYPPGVEEYTAGAIEGVVEQLDEDGDLVYEGGHVRASARCDITIEGPTTTTTPAAIADPAAVLLEDEPLDDAGPEDVPYVGTASARTSASDATPAAAPSSTTPSALEDDRLAEATSGPARNGPATLRVRLRGIERPLDPGYFRVGVTADVDASDSYDGASPDERGEAEIVGLEPGRARVLVYWPPGARAGTLSAMFSRKIDLIAGVQVVDLELPPLSTLNVVVGRGGRVRLWRLDDGAPMASASILRAAAGTETLQFLPRGRWLAVFEPEKYILEEAPTTAPGLLSHLERRFTTPETTEIRFD